MPQIQIFIVDFLQQKNDCVDQLQRYFSELPNWQFEVLCDLERLKNHLAKTEHALILPVVCSKELSRLNHLTSFLDASDQAITIAIICGCDSQSAHDLVRVHIDDFIFWPFTKSEIVARVNRFFSSVPYSRCENVQQNLLIKFGSKKIIGKDPQFLKVFSKARRFAKCDAPAIIYGETGTGKECIARAIHYCSSRASKPFIAINCAAIPPELFENELFGHVKGAFTGATTRQEGLIKAAEQGTLFLDEIDSILPAVQAKLLRFLEEKEFKLLGMNKISKADVRIVVAAKDDLQLRVRENTFRDDLFYRLNVLALSLPSLRHRRVDIPLLAKHFLAKYAIELSRPYVYFAPGALKGLCEYPWPGNIRELENVVYRAVALCQRPAIHRCDLEIAQDQETNHEFPRKEFKEAKAEAVENFERNFITDLLVANGGNITLAAKDAGKHRRAFWELMRKYDINPSAIMR